MWRLSWGWRTAPMLGAARLGGRFCRHSQTWPRGGKHGKQERPEDELSGRGGWPSPDPSRCCRRLHFDNLTCEPGFMGLFRLFGHVLMHFGQLLILLRGL